MNFPDPDSPLYMAASSPSAGSPDMRALFEQAYGSAPSIVARAPGRVEFIGNHTDYNGGAVLGAAINRFVWVAAAPNSVGRFRLRSTRGTTALELMAIPTTRLTGTDAWANYPLGVWQSLRDFNLPQPTGFDLLVEADLPAGAGLSSSAALELATALALLNLARPTALAPEQLAALARHAENKYVGVPCGILDQGTSALGRAGQLVQIDCRTPAFSLVPLPTAAHLWVFNTREKHALIDGLYATRHQECLSAANALGVKWLADLTPEQLAPLKPKLFPVLARRAEHIVAEHARVHATVVALQQNDLAAVGRLLTASHRSSQLLFENSTARLDQLVDLLTAHPAIYGARLTGGGFGGAVLALTRADFTATQAAKILAPYAATHGTPAEGLHLQSADGASIERLD